jgi:hypothetical protein
LAGFLLRSRPKALPLALILFFLSLKSLQVP